MQPTEHVVPAELFSTVWSGSHALLLVDDPLHHSHAIVAIHLQLVSDFSRSTDVSAHLLCLFALEFI